MDPDSVGTRLTFSETVRPTLQQLDEHMTQDFLSAELALHLDAADELSNILQRTASVRRIAVDFINSSAKARQLGQRGSTWGSGNAAESPMHLEFQGAASVPHHRSVMDDLTDL